MLSTAGPYDEALERFHRTGPEFDGSLSNHGPMAADALLRLGQQEVIHRWTDGYLRRLEGLPRGINPIHAEEWRDALGSVSRMGDWLSFFEQEARERAWDELLLLWWPRLLPGIAAGATHGVIRVGHAVRALRLEVTAPRRAELGQALAYWAARWQPVPEVAARGHSCAAEVVPRVPRVPRQENGISARLGQLGDTPRWAETAASLTAPGEDAEVPAALESVIDAVLRFYAGNAHGNPTMLVHAATAPNAVLNVLPSLPPSMWLSSFRTAWTASAAVVAAYRPAAAPPPSIALEPGSDADAVVAQAVRHGGEHVLKLTDTAVRAFGRSQDDQALLAARVGIALDA